MMRCLYSFFVLTTAWMAGQTPSDGHVSMQASRSMPEMESQLESFLSQLDPAKLRPVVAGSWESEIVDSAREAAKLTVRRHLQEPDGLYTIVNRSGDVLVARWTRTGSGGERAIWLWDTPGSMTLLIEVSASVFEVNALIRYCEELLVWDEPPVNLKSLRLSFATSTGKQRWAFGEGDHATQERGSFQWHLAAMARSQSGFIGITASKPLFRGLYPPDSLVPERFPPLKERIKVLARAELFSELENGLKRTGNAVGYPNPERDRVIIEELLSRGPVSAADVRRIVIGPFAKRDYRSAVAINSRLLSFLDAAEHRGELGSAVPALEVLCLESGEYSGLPEIAVQNVFARMNRNQLDFSQTAVRLLERDQFVSPSLYYLEWHAHDETTLKELSKVAVKPEWESRKRQAVERISERLRVSGGRQVR